LCTDVQAMVRHNPPFVHRVFVRMLQGHEFIVARIIAYRQSPGPQYGFPASIAATFQALTQKRELPARWRSIEATHTDIDRVYRAATEKRDDLIAQLLQLETLLDNSRMVFCHLNRIRIAKEIRSVKHENVERVALDPLAAIDQSSQLAYRFGDRDPQCVFHC